MLKASSTYNLLPRKYSGEPEIGTVKSFKSLIIKCFRNRPNCIVLKKVYKKSKLKMIDS